MALPLLPPPDRPAGATTVQAGSGADRSGRIPVWFPTGSDGIELLENRFTDTVPVGTAWTLQTSAGVSQPGSTPPDPTSPTNHALTFTEGTSADPFAKPSPTSAGNALYFFTTPGAVVATRCWAWANTAAFSRQGSFPRQSSMSVFYHDGTSLTELVTRVTAANTWQRLERIIKLPATATQFYVWFYGNPSAGGTGAVTKFANISVLVGKAYEAPLGDPRSIESASPGAGIGTQTNYTYVGPYGPATPKYDWSATLDAANLFEFSSVSLDPGNRLSIARAHAGD